MKLTSETIKQMADKIGCGGVGIGNIERFANAPRMMHPKNIFPSCKSVISVVQPIPRSVYRGITEGTHWANYTFYGYSRLNSLFRPQNIYELCRFIEDQGYEAVPVYPGVAERPGLNKSVAPGRPPYDINLNVRAVGVACGLGEIGWSKIFLHKKYGPRVRLGTILTDAVLEPDPLIEPGTLCNRCMRCVKDCPGNAIPKPNEKETIKIQIEDKTYEWADVHMGRCTLTHHGFNWECSPFLKKSVPGLDLDVKNSNISEESAYKLTCTIARGKWKKSEEFPSGAVIEYYKQIEDQIGYFAVCGAKGCIRACMDTMEKRNAIEQSDFKTPLQPRKPWKLTPPSDDEVGGVAEGKFPEDYNYPDPNAGCWE